MDVYKQLFQALEDGGQAAVVSRYRGSRTEKTLIIGDIPRERNGAGGGDCPGFSRSGDEAVLTEYYTPVPRLIILGGGHIAVPLSSFGARLGFNVTVFDDRPSFANAARFPDARAVVCDGFANMTRRLKIGKNDYVVIVTRGHRHDALCLRGLLDGEFPVYAGMIGSRRRVAIVKAQLSEETGAVSGLDRLHAPIGLAIGAVTPEEIAVSILAEIIQCRRQGQSGSPRGSCPDMELLEWLAEDRDEKFALVTVISTEGSTPRETGAKMAVTSCGQTVGSIGGGCAEAEAIRKAIEIMQSGGYTLINIDMTDSAGDDGMVCGGSMTALIEAV